MIASFKFYLNVVGYKVAIEGVSRALLARFI